jgi:glucuronate isomerase
MTEPLRLSADRLFPTDLNVRVIAQRLYQAVAALPIVSPHGHTDANWFATDATFIDATELLLKPDHYLLRMLYSQGISLQELGLGSGAERSNRRIWRRFAENYYLFRGTPSRLWLDTVFAEVFGMQTRLDASTADDYYDHITADLQTNSFRPRALFDQFNIELLATTESPLNDLLDHQIIRDGSWQGRVITTYRPDPVVDPEFDGFAANVAELGRLTGEDTSNWSGYLNAHRQRREFFKTLGATASDHGHPTALSLDLTSAEAEQLFSKAVSGSCTADEAEMFRGQMLTEMAGMSRDDGLVMQLHSGSLRNHNAPLFAELGRDIGADIPQQTDYVNALRPLLNKFGNHPDFSMIVFTLDESSYSRELAPLAGHYPALKLGPAWWFHDSPEGMRRFRQQTIESAGFYNTVGFNDDTRAFLSIPARHDMARRMDCGFLAELVADHRLQEDEAAELAVDLAYRLVKRAYKL